MLAKRLANSDPDSLLSGTPLLLRLDSETPGTPATHDSTISPLASVVWQRYYASPSRLCCLVLPTTLSRQIDL